MRILVLGGTAFIGRRIVERLVERGDEVMVVHRGITSIPDWVEVHELLTDRVNLATHRGEVEAFGPDAIVDSFALTRTDARIAIEALPRVPTVVLSSQDVYAAFGALRTGTFAAPVPLTERSPVRTEYFPYRDLAGTKIPADYEKLHVEEEWLGRDATVLRLPMVYGPHDDQRREDPILRRVRAGRSRIPVGSGTLLWSRAHVDDVAAGVLAAIDSQAGAGKVVNLAERHCYPIRIWYEQILAAAGSDAELVRVPEAHIPPDLGLSAPAIQDVLVSVELAEELFGWGAGDPVRRVAESVRWHLDHPPKHRWDEDDSRADDEALAHALDAG